MQKKIGIVYSTVDGQTLKICKAIAQSLNEKGLEPEMHSMENFVQEPSRFNLLIIGASVRCGKHHALITNFVSNYKEELNKIKTAFFSVNLVARKEGKDQPGSNPYLIKFLRKVDWEPGIPGVFAGKLDYPSYSFFDRIMIKLIMKMTGGPTKSEKPIEYTDWKRVEDFSEKIYRDYIGG